MALVVPSVLSADFGRLAEQVQAAEAGGADRLQIDVMDGRFVPNITVGPLVVEAIRRNCRLPLEIHLMIVEPERYLADFAAAGGDILIVHQEVSPHLHRTIERDQATGQEGRSRHQSGDAARRAAGNPRRGGPGTLHDGRPRVWRSVLHPQYVAQD